MSVSISATKIGEIIEELGEYFDWESRCDKGEEVDGDIPDEVEGSWDAVLEKVDRRIRNGGRKYKGVKYPFKKPTEEGRPGWFEVEETPRIRAFREKDPQGYHELNFSNAAGYWASMARGAMEIVVEETVDFSGANEQNEREAQKKRVEQVLAIASWCTRMSEGVLALRVSYLEMRRKKGVSEANYLMGRFMDKVEAPTHGLWGDLAKESKKETELAMRKAHARQAAERKLKKKGDKGHVGGTSGGASESE